MSKNKKAETSLTAKRELQNGKSTVKTQLYFYSLWVGGSHSSLQLHISASIGHRQVVLLSVIK